MFASDARVGLRSPVAEGALQTQPFMSDSKVEAVLLDLGNVLAFHDNALLCRKLADAAQTLPEPLHAALQGPLAELINRGDLDAEGIRVEVSRALNANLPMEEFIPLFSSHFTIHDAVLRRVERLCEQVPVVLLSNTNALHWNWLRPRLPVLERFRGHCLSHVERLVKPEPAIYQRAADIAGVPLERCVFFDDIPAYVDAARAVGMKAFVFTDAAAFDRDLTGLGL